MILQALTNYYEVLADEHKVPRRGWCTAKVSYALDIDVEGTLKTIIPQLDEVQMGKKTVQVAKKREVPEMVTRSSGVSSNFLCDNSKYILGIDANGTNPRLMECFLAAREKHCAILAGCAKAPSVAVRNFFEKWEPENARNHPELNQVWDEVTAGGNLIFSVDGEFVQEDDEVRKAWEDVLDDGEEGTDGMCLVTGTRTEIARIHSAIKGVKGAQSSGAALVSFNAPAFESYGKEQSYNAPVGKYAAFAYTTALNYLMSQRDYLFYLGDTAVMFWAANGDEAYQDAFDWSLEPKEDNQELIRGIFKNIVSHQPVDIDGIQLDSEQPFYILGLAPNAARLSVRFFYEDSFGNILKNLKQHYDRMEIVKPVWDTMDLLGIHRMLDETVNKNTREKKVVANMAAGVLKAILSGGRYPESLFMDTLMRIRAEQGTISRGRAAIIKAYLIRNYDRLSTGEGDFVGLNEASNDTAYVLGRTFSVLEQIQQKANPEINATIKDRYFNAACATPGTIFPILMKLKNSHMKKIKEEGARINFEKLLTDLLGRLEFYPPRLSLDAQGMFILGYYHQTQKRFEKKEEK